MKTEKSVTFTISDELAGELRRMQRVEMRDSGSIIIETLREYIEKRQFKEFQKEAAMAAKAIGIYDEADVNRIIHEYRSGK